MTTYEPIKLLKLVDSGEAKLQTGPFGTQLKASDYVDFGTPVINVRNVGFGDIRDKKLEFLDDKMVEKLSNHQLKRGDIVFGRKGAVERHAFIKDIGEGWVQGSDCLRLRITSEAVDSRFVSYYLRTKTHQDWMIAVCSFGATMASLNQDIVKLITIPLPPIEVQKKITAVLATYDDLIENNKRRISLLESMANQIYREWFVRFRFPEHKSVDFDKGKPQDWMFEKAENFFCHVKGKSYKSEELTEDFEDSKPFITLKSFNKGGGYREEGLKRYKGRYREEQLVSEDDVIMAVTDMTQDREVVGRVARVPNIKDGEAVISLDVIKLVPIGISKTFLYCFMKYSGFGDHIKTFANGANVLHLKPDLVTQQKILMPTKNVRDKFDEIVTPIHKQMNELSTANNILEKTKLSLLPRLISGKNSLKELNIQFPPSMRD